MDDLIKRVEAAREELERWPQKDLELSEHIPTEGLCSVCYLTGLHSGGQEEQRPHVVIVLCPSPGAFIQTYRWSGDRLVVDQKLLADSTAVEASIKGLVDRYVGKGPPPHNGGSPEASGP
jgi:hypothetical protein